MRVLALSLFVLNGVCSSAFADPIALNNDEAKLGQMINSFRSALNLPTMQYQSQLQSLAQSYSSYMGSYDFFSHTGLDGSTMQSRLHGAGYAYTAAGENIACGRQDATSTFRQWAFSPGHLANLVNPHYREMGLSRADNQNDDCSYYWTHDMGTRTSLSKDPLGTTDINLIRNAIAAVSGAIPADQVVSLDLDELQQGGGGTTGTSSSGTGNSNSGGTTPTPATTGGNASSSAPSAALAAYNQLARVGGASMAQQSQPISLLQCVIPYAIAKNILVSNANTDVFLEARKTANGDYNVTLTYFQNGQASNLSSLNSSGVTMSRNSDLNSVNLFAGQTNLTGAYSIQVNTGSNHAQFDSFGIVPGVTATIPCQIQN